MFEKFSLSIDMSSRSVTFRTFVLNVFLFPRGEQSLQTIVSNQSK